MVSKEIRSKLKIGLVIDGGLAKPDGVQQYVLAVGSWLSHQGHEVRYITVGEIAPGINNADSLGGSVGVNSHGRFTMPQLVSRKRLKQYIESENFDVIHVQVPYSPLMGEQLVFLSPDDTAIIGTFHVVPFKIPNKIGNWILGHYSQFSIKKFDKLFSVSKPAQAIARRDFGVESEISPNVFDYEKFHNAIRLKKYDDSKVNILFLGRLSERKGCIILLKAVNQLVKAGLDQTKIRVIVAGSGELEDMLKAYVKQEGLDKCVEFLGFIDEKDKPSIYASSDISVFPSTAGESFGIVLIEAMACGRAAVLGGNNLGYSYVLSPQPDLIFDTTDSSALASKLEELIKDKALRTRYARWGEKYAKKYDVEVVGKQLEDVYYKIVCEKQPYKR
jgi:phosphatidylinositol alpha-mannosyltransferase